MALRVLRKNNQLFLMKIVVTGTRGIPDIMGGVETHCEELFPRIAEKDFDVTVIRRTNYVKDDLTEWKGVKLLDIESPKKNHSRRLSILSGPSIGQKNWGRTSCISMPSALPCLSRMQRRWA